MRPRQPPCPDPLQGHYTSNNPTMTVSPLAEAVVGALDSLAGELLFRGVVVGGLAVVGDEWCLRAVRILDLRLRQRQLVGGCALKEYTGREGGV